MTSDNQQPPSDPTGLNGLEGDNEMGGMESAEQYMRAHELIERLRADQRPTRAGGDEQDARLSATAALLHAAAPESAAIDPLFAANLFDRLQAAQAARETQAGQAKASPQPLAAQPEPAPAASARPAGSVHDGERPRRVGVTRRGLLLGGLGATAAAVAGATITNALEQPRPAGGGSAPPTTPLTLEGAGTWVAVATLADVPPGAVKRFEAGAIIGYLQHTASGFVALSGVCTHMACLLQWNGADRTFDCPCHGGRFLANGQSAPGGRYAYAPLPAIQTKVEGEQVLVYVAGASAGAQSDGKSGANSVGPGGYGGTTSAKATPH